MKAMAKWGVVLCLVCTFLGCAVGPRQPWQSFEFSARRDGWSETVDLLAYQYGDTDRMLAENFDRPRSSARALKNGLVPEYAIGGSMPIGEFLYVKWRVCATGQIFEERVDLRDRLPWDMKDHALTFVIDGPQLYVYVVTPKPKPIYGAPPLERTWLSKSNITYEIFPQFKKP